MMQQPSISTYFRASKKRGRGESDNVDVVGKLKLQAVVGGVGEDGRDLPAKKHVFIHNNKEETATGTDEQQIVESNKEPVTVKFVHKAPCSPQKKKAAGISKEEMKKLLEAKGMKLKDLQAALKSIKGAAKNIEELRSKALLANSASTRPAHAVPAYQRYSHLIDSGTAASTSKDSASSPSKWVLSSPKKKVDDSALPLPLPYNYRVLEELFKGVETVCHIMEGRSETLTLTKLREGVFSLFKKVKLGEEHFAQFLTVLPGCFTVRWEGKSKKNLDLVVVRPEGVRGSREASFRKALQDIVLKFHETYLLSLSPPMEVDKSKIRRWHPSFRLDAVPDVERVSDFPVQPVFDTVSSAKDVLAKVKDMVAVNERMQRALYKSAAEAEKNCGTSAASVAVPKSNAGKRVDAKNVKQLKGISQALLDKIRQREQEKKVRSLTLSKSELDELSMLDRLPSVVHVIHNTFVGERKPALALDLVLERISHSVGLKEVASKRDWSLSCVSHLSENYGDFLSVHKLSESTFVKINRDCDINLLCTKIKAEKKNKN